MQAAYAGTLADVLIPRTGDRSRDLFRDVALVVGCTVMVTLMAQVRIPLPFTPVPITGQTFGALVAGAALGSKRGASGMGLYLVLGSVGLPVFAGWKSGPVWTLASGGYIIGFVAAAYVVGWLAERGWDRRPLVLVAMLIGNIIIYIPGLLQLSFFVPEGRVLEFGLWPFIPGDLVKLYLASMLLPGAWALVLTGVGQRKSYRDVKHYHRRKRWLS